VPLISIKNYALTINLLLQATPDGGDCSLYNTLNRTSDTGQEQLPADQLIGVMQHLTLNPGKFDVLITPLVDTFGLWLGNAVTASSVVNAIVEQVGYGQCPLH
jgi:hypothetical protein